MAVPKGYGGATVGPGAPSIVAPKVKKAVTSYPGGTLTLPPPPTAENTGLTGKFGPPVTTLNQAALDRYRDAILANPSSVAAQGRFNATGTDLATARADAIRRALIASGWTPGDITAKGLSDNPLGGFSSDVTQSVLDQAAANPMSEKAQLDYRYGQAKGLTPYQLAATGADRSGALAIQLGNLGRSFDEQSYQGVNNLLNSITSTLGDYTTKYGEAQNTLEAARRDVGNALASVPGYADAIYTTEPGWLPSTSPGQLSPSYPTPTVNDTVQKAIAALGYKPKKPAPASIYRTIKQTILGG